MNIRKARGKLYRLARVLGDVQAMLDGPEAYVKRLARKQALKASGKSINHAIRRKGR